jgi:hypothetical protein
MNIAESELTRNGGYQDIILLLKDLGLIKK